MTDDVRRDKVPPETKGGAPRSAMDIPGYSELIDNIASQISEEEAHAILGSLPQRAKKFADENRPPKPDIEDEGSA